MTTAKTAVERIIGDHAGRLVTAGDVVIVDVDFVMAQDGNAPLAIQLMREELKSDHVFDPGRVVLVIDHCSPSPNERVSNLQQAIRQFCEGTGTRLFDIGEGISHVVLPEHGFARPGGLVVGSDSHCVTYGAVNCLGTGMGSTDIAVAMVTGKTWLRVPETVSLVLHGSRQRHTSAKDVALAMVRLIGVDGANYKCVEFSGSGLSRFSMDERFTLCNMTIEVGAKCSLMPLDETSTDYLRSRLQSIPEMTWAESGCCYDKELSLELDLVTPLVALPHSLANIVEVDALDPRPRIDQAFLGTCTNGRLQDLHAAADVLKGRRIDPRVRMIVTPGSKSVYLDAMRLGYLESLVLAGAVITTPGCGACVGTHAGVPADDEVVISSANRNFQGRMGNASASIILASPETVAASAILGRVASVVELL